jgi:uncharacterized protein
MKSLMYDGGRRVLLIITIAAFAYIAVIGGLYVFQRHLLYHPSTARPSLAGAGVPELSDVILHTADGLELTSWYAAAASGKPTLVYYHGNAGNIGHRGHRVRPFLDASWGVLLVGYRGFGGNPGAPSEAGLIADGMAAQAFLDDAGVPHHLRILHGESLGSGVATAVASTLKSEQNSRVGAIVLEAPYTSIADVAAYHYPFVPARYLVRDRFDSISRIGQVDTPLLFVHGLNDRVVPVRFGKMLFDAAAEPKEAHWIEGAGHNDLADHGITDIVTTFVMERLGQEIPPMP